MTEALVILRAFLLIGLAYLVGYRPFDIGTDYESYIEIYNEKFFVEPFFYVAAKIFQLFGLDGTLFIFVLSLFSMHIFAKSLNHYSVSWVDTTCAFVAYYAFLQIASFRAGVALSFFLYLYSSQDRDWIRYSLSSLTHASFLFVSAVDSIISAKSKGYGLLFFTGLLCLPFALPYLHDVATLLDKERAYQSLLTPGDYEFRSLFEFSNFKLYYCILLILVGRFGSVHRIFYLSPVGYLIFSPVAYFSERVFLSCYPLLFIGLSSCRHRLVKLLLYMLIFPLFVRDLILRLS
jgi:hypothetical protein